MAAKKKTTKTKTKAKPGEVSGKSCYLLGVWHGAPFEYDERHVYTDPEHIRLCAEQVVNDLRSDAQSGAVGVESDIVLWVIEAGALAAAHDLKPHIRMAVKDEPETTFDRAAESAALDTVIAELAAGATDPDALWRREVRVALDWAPLGAKLPALVGPPLKPGERQPVTVGPGLLLGAALQQTARSYALVAFGSRELNGVATITPPAGLRG